MLAKVECARPVETGNKTEIPVKIYCMNGPSYFEIQADDLDRAMTFYREVFGWNFKKAEGLPIEYWRIETDGPQGGMLKRPAAVPPRMSGTNAFVCSMEVDNFDDIAKNILNHDGVVALPKFAVPGTCWQGYSSTRKETPSESSR